MKSTAMLVLLSFASLAMAAPSLSMTIESSNPGFESSNRHGCLTASSNAPGAPVIIQDCISGSDGQNWVYIFTNTTAPLPGSGQVEYYTLQWRVFGDKCLDVKDGLNADGTKLQLWPCVDGNTNQLWLQRDTGIYEWNRTNKCIDLTDGITTPGNPIQVWTCVAQNDNQKWARGIVFPPIVATRPPSTVTTSGTVFTTSGTTILGAISSILPPPSSASTDDGGILSTLLSRLSSVVSPLSSTKIVLPSGLSTLLPPVTVITLQPTILSPTILSPTIITLQPTTLSPPISTQRPPV